MRYNFNTIIYPIYGILLGINYWNTKMDHVTTESPLEEGVENSLEIHFFFIGITFIWYTDKK